MEFILHVEHADQEVAIARFNRVRAKNDFDNFHVLHIAVFATLDISHGVEEVGQHSEQIAPLSHLFQQLVLLYLRILQRKRLFVVLL